MKYLSKAEEKFENNWTQYEKQLEQYLTKNKDYKDWVSKKDDLGNIYWINLKTLKEQKEHPGHKVFSVNKKILKAKAEEELHENFKGIYERRMRILETVLDLKHKISRDLSKTRLRFMTEQKQQQHSHCQKQEGEQIEKGGDSI